MEINARLGMAVAIPIANDGNRSGAGSEAEVFISGRSGPDARAAGVDGPDARLEDADDRGDRSKTGRGLVDRIGQSSDGDGSSAGCPGVCSDGQVTVVEPVPDVGLVIVIREALLEAV